MPKSESKLPLLVAGLILYLLATGASYAFFAFVSPKTQPANVSSNQDGKKTGEFTAPQKKYANLPRTEQCPLNGAKYSVPEREIWEKRRPLGVMVENPKAARPQSGLSAADVVYEAIAEGGITRFLAVYYCQDADFVGPVRSARTYYLDWISEYGVSPLYAHVGGANTPGPADALGQIERYGWGGFNDLNQFSIGFPTFIRDYDRLGPDTPTEHTVYASTAKLWDFAAKKRSLTNVEIDDRTKKEIAWDQTFIPYKFKEDATLADRPSGISAQFALSGGQTAYASDYIVKWQYDRASNSYLRFNGGEAHKDLNTNQQLVAKNIALLFMPMTIADDGYSEEGHGAHTLYNNKGSGKAKFLIDGQVIDGTWAKKTRTDKTKFFDSKGIELALNRGPIWIEILPINQAVTIE